MKPWGSGSPERLQLFHQWHCLRKGIVELLRIGPAVEGYALRVAETHRIVERLQFLAVYNADVAIEKRREFDVELPADEAQGV